MNISKTIGTGIAALALTAAFSGQALAGATEAVNACKTSIVNDAQLGGYERVDARMDTMKRRGRYTYFQFDVYGRLADGEREAWTAECKARSSGKIDELLLSRVASESEQQVAQADAASDS